MEEEIKEVVNLEELEVVEVPEEEPTNIFVKLWWDICDFFRGIKTYILGAPLIVVGFLETFDWIDLIPKEFMGLWNLGIGLAVVYLRMVTKGPARWFSR
jgi:hypothetical protein